MASMMAIVSKAVFAKEAKGASVGDVYATDCYRSKSRALSALEDGGTLFLVTVRPDDVLWLVGVLENPKLGEDGWSAAANTVAIRDVSSAIGSLRFNTGKGITAAPGKLGMSLQSPRVLTDDDVALLRGGGTAPTKKAPKSKKPPSTSDRPKTRAAPAPAPPKDDDAPEEVMAWLLECWSATRSHEVATVIARYGEAHESADAKAARALTKIPNDEWLALTRGSVVDLGAPLATLSKAPAAQVKDRIKRVGWRVDPRVCDAFHEIIRTIPWVSTGTRSVWTALFQELGKLADPRTIGVVEAFDPGGISSSWSGPAEWMSTRLNKLAKTVEEQQKWRPLEPDEAERVRAIAAALPTSKGAAASGASLEDQLDFVYAHPDDVEARLVLADLLQERGDVRGELISLQHHHASGSGTRDSKKREKQILKDHQDVILGPLAGLVKKRDLEIELGFVRRCELKDRIHAVARDELDGAKMLSTVRHARGPLDVLAIPEFANLTTAAGPIWGMDEQLEAVFELDRALPFRSFETWIRGNKVPLIGKCRSLPHLETLRLGLVADESIHDVLDMPLVAQVQTFQLYDSDGTGLPVLAERIPSVGGKLTAFGGFAYEVSPDWSIETKLSKVGDKWSSIDVLVSLPSGTWGGSTARAHEVLTAQLRVLAQFEIEQVTVRSLKKIRDADVRERLERTVRSTIGREDVSSFELD